MFQRRLLLMLTAAAVFVRTMARVCSLVVVIVCMPALASAGWLKSDPDSIPDVDKSQPDASCWLATAANMLAGAGYGDGVTHQLRAEDIYNELLTHFNRYD